jgi:hypothetical protein
VGEWYDEASKEGPKVEIIRQAEDKSVALKYDNDKVPWELCPFGAVEGMLEVLKYGKNKYTVRDEEGNVINEGAHNWRKGFKWSRLIGAAYRHLTAFTKGEDFDPESNLNHLYHLMCCVAFLCEHYQQELGVDDRHIYPEYEEKP